MGRVAGFRSVEGRAQYLLGYDRALAASTVAVDEVDLPTKYGQTHVVRAGAADAPALVVLHGTAMSSTMWIDQLPMFAERHRVYLVDTIGEMNKSVATTTLRSRDDVTVWLDEVLDALDIDKTAMLGFSYGAWMAATYAIERPTRVERLALLSPAAVFSRVQPRWMARAMDAHLLRPRRDTAKKFFDSMLMPATVGRLAALPFAAVVEQYLTGTPQFRIALRVAMPCVYRAEVLSALTMATLVVIGEDDTVCDGPKAAARAKDVLPLARVELLTAANHYPNVDAPEVFNDLVREFLHQPG